MVVSVPVASHSDQLSTVDLETIVAGPSNSSIEEFPPHTRADVLACSFSSWYPLFKHVSPKATIIKPIGDDFIEYLESDRIFVPEGSGPMGVSELSDSDSDSDEDSTLEETTGDSGDQSDLDSTELDNKSYSFPHLDTEIRRIIFKYEGAVFPKLNWSSPQDAVWMVPGPPLKCQTPADVYLLLKASDFISHDLDHAFDFCDDQDLYKRRHGSPSSPSILTSSTIPPLATLTATRPTAATLAAEGEDMAMAAPQPSTNKGKQHGHDIELVLKKWFDMPKSQEWRCFVRDRELVGICQRDKNYYEFLQGPRVKEELTRKIKGFYEVNIKAVFSRRCYVFDIYLTRNNERVFVIDFNPYAPQTDPLLFTYSQLASGVLSVSDESVDSIQLPIFRVIDSPAMSSSMPTYSHNRYPKDVIDLSEGNTIAEFAKEWQEKLKKGVEDDAGAASALPNDRSCSKLINKKDNKQDLVGR